jgi:hypothetical protein
LLYSLVSRRSSVALRMQAKEKSCVRAHSKGCLAKRRVSDVAIGDALVVLIEKWDDVIAGMDAESRAVLARLLTGLYEPGQPDAIARIADLLVETLPCDHPVRRALADGTLFALATVDWPALVCHLRELSLPRGIVES